MSETNKVNELQTQDERNSFIKMAIEKDLDITKIQLMMDLRDRDEERKFKQEFEYHFAEMQKDYVPAIKSKKVTTKNGAYAYSYCPLPEIQKVYAPILSKHGFSFRWEEKTLENKEKEITCFLSGYGHVKKASIVLPVITENQLTNAIQMRATTTEYGRRYSFMNVTGCIVADENGSGELPVDDPEIAKKTILKLLPLIPVAYRNKYIEKTKSESNKEVMLALNEINELRNRIVKIVESVKAKGNEEETKKVTAGIQKIENKNQLCDWEEYVETL